MFIVTARVPRKRLLAGAVAFLCCCTVVLTAVVITLNGRAVTTSAEAGGIKDNEDRVAYLEELGWQADPQPAITEELLIPETFDQSYDNYLALQSQQGFDLTKYAGKRVKRYTYNITNAPEDQQGLQASLLIYRNKVVGAQLQLADGTALPLVEAKP